MTVQGNHQCEGPEAKPTIAVLIVSYQTRQMLLDCISSLLATTPKGLIEVFVWDNHSSDGSAEAVSQAFPQVHLIASKENIGFGAANNRLAELADSEYILLLNPDTLVMEHAVERLLAFADRKPEAKLWGGKTLFPNGSLNPTSCWGFPSLRSLFFDAIGLRTLFRGSAWTNPEGIGGWQRNTEREVDMISGCLLLIKRAFWSELGGFSPLFWMYSEDADLCMRARKVGAQPRFTPDVVIVHIGGASERVRSAKRIRLNTAKALFYKQHWNGVSAAIGSFLLRLHAINRLAAFTVLAATRGEVYSERREEWRQIWRARGAWSQHAVGRPQDQDAAPLKKDDVGVGSL